MHSPRPEHLFGHSYEVHAAPDQPASHAHVPLWHAPWPLQPLGQQDQQPFQVIGDALLADGDSRSRLSPLEHGSTRQLSLWFLAVALAVLEPPEAL